MKHYKVLSAILCIAFGSGVPGAALAQSSVNVGLEDAKRQIEARQTSFFRAFATGDSTLFADPRRNV